MSQSYNEGRTLVSIDGLERFPNRAFPYTLVMLGVWFGLLWLATGAVLYIRLDESPFLLWANVASRILTLVGLTWALFVVPFLAWVISWVNTPPEIAIGSDCVAGSPPRASGNPPARRHVVIRFEVLGKVGWGPLGPGVYGNRIAPRGAMLLLSPRNARIIRDRWTSWKQIELDPAPMNLPPTP